MLKRIGSILCLLFVCFAQMGYAQTSDPVKVEIVHEEGSIQPGRTFSVGIRFQLDDTWHAYWKNPDNPGMEPQVEWQLPANFEVGGVQWPVPKALVSNGIETFVYEDELVLLAEITPPATFDQESVSIAADLRWVVCDDSTCLPGNGHVEVSLPVKSSEPDLFNAHAEIIAKARTRLPGYGEEVIAMLDPSEVGGNIHSHGYQGGFFLALGLAFLGGLILNLMPCVLPVISFKILSFVKMSGQSRSLIFKHGLFFSLGVLVSFWALASVLLILKAYGSAVGWGFQLQEPLFVAILAAIIFIFGLSLFGVFELGAGFASMAGQAQVKSGQNSGLMASFFSGILATAVATPCTGPFLGTAIGFAVTLSAPLALLIFSSLGLGMAFPYLMVGAFPGMIRFLPKPGNWMVTFKEVMGFIMVATVLWLVWVFGAQTDVMGLFMLLAGFFFLSVGCWIYGKWGSPVNKKITRLISATVALSAFVMGGYTIYQASTMEPTHTVASVNHDWEEFSPQRLEELQAQGVPVFIDFTAKWCLICQANHLILSTEQVSNRFSDRGVVRMKADWTKNDPVITEMLAKFGRNGVPLYVLYSGDKEGKPAILPQVLTQEVVLSHLNQI